MDVLIPGLPEEIGLHCLIRVHHQTFPLLRRVCRRWKQATESTLFHRLRRSSGFSRPLVIFNQVPKSSSLISPPCLASFQPSSGDWSPFPSIPFSPRSLPICCGLAASNLHLVVVGGWYHTDYPSTAVHVYSFLSSTWARGAPMPAPARSFFACAANANSQVFVAGGRDEENNALESAMVYDIAKDEWTMLPEMARQRVKCTGVFIDGKAGGRFVVVGGYCTSIQGRFKRSIEVFDVGEWRWQAVEEQVVETMEWGRRCAAGGDGRVYMCDRGGMMVVVKEGEEWREVAELPEDVRVGTKMVALGGGLMMFGRSYCDGGWVGAAHVLELKEGTAIGRRRVELPKEYSHCVLSACCINI